jgi:hypothetical protein
MDNDKKNTTAMIKIQGNINDDEIIAKIIIL